MDITGRGLVPPACRMVRGGGMGKASPYCAGAQFGSFPPPAGRSRGIVQGAMWPAEPRSSRVHRSTPAHPPVAALLPLGGALGWLPAVAPMVQQGQPGTVGREGDKSRCFIESTTCRYLGKRSASGRRQDSCGQVLRRGGHVGNLQGCPPCPCRRCSCPSGARLSQPLINCFLFLIYKKAKSFYNI